MAEVCIAEAGNESPPLMASVLLAEPELEDDVVDELVAAKEQRAEGQPPPASVPLPRKLLASVATSEQKDQRRRTLVLGKLPRFATENHITAAVDHALRRQGSIRQAKILRDAEGSSKCWGFFEFADDQGAAAAYVACQNGLIALDDPFDYTWYVEASYARRATLGCPSAFGRRSRGRQATRCKHDFPVMATCT